MVSGMKYAKDRKADTQAIDGYFRNKQWDWLPPAGAYDFYSDYYSLACLMYSFYVGNLVRSPDRLFHPVWATREQSYKRIHLKHFIEVVFASATSNNLPSSYMGHPFFKDETWMSDFEDRFRSFSSSRKWMDKFFEGGKDIVFRGNFMNPLEPSVGDLVNRQLRKSNQYSQRTTTIGSTFLDLWISIRNRKHHRDEDLDSTQLLER